MLLAVVVYLLIYMGMITYLRSNAESLRQFCETIPAEGASYKETMERAEALGLSLTEVASDKQQQTYFFIANPEQTDAVCKGIEVKGIITNRQFVLKWF